MTLDSVFEDIANSDVKAYTRYWKSIAPKTDDDILRRWLFAYTSIHTTWESNVRGYNAIKDFEEWVNDRPLLLQKLIDAKCGMHNKRTEYIWDFTMEYLQDPSKFHRQKNESWRDMRNRLVKACRGIGFAKVSFTLEMCYPDKAQVTCLDTHMIQLYGIDAAKFSSSNAALYEEHESDWIERCKQVGCSPTIGRAIFWDRKQNQPDSRYWTYVLES